jgi:hypothetical protein
LLVLVGEWRLSDPNEPLPSGIEELLDSPLIANSPAAAGGIRVFPDEGGRAGYYFSPIYLKAYLKHWEDMLRAEQGSTEETSPEPSAVESGSPSAA